MPEVRDTDQGLRSTPLGSLFDASVEKVIRDGYAEFSSRRVEGRERLEALVAKIHEEIAEAVEAFERDNIDDFIGELADVVEVCHALGGRHAVEAARQSKRASKGGFSAGLVMRLDERTADGHGRPL